MGGAVDLDETRQVDLGVALGGRQRGVSQQLLDGAEIAATGVRINVVAPGPTDTPLLRDDPNIDAYAETLPLGRVIRPDEIAAAVVFALLEDTTLTAQVISPNGGAVP